MTTPLRRITVPPCFVPVIPGMPDELREGVKQTYDAFVRYLLDHDSRFTTTAAGLRAAVRIEQALLALDNIDGQETHSLQDDDWKLLCTVAEAPEKGYPTLTSTNSTTGQIVGTIVLGRQFLGFINALAAAKVS